MNDFLRHLLLHRLSALRRILTLWRLCLWFSLAYWLFIAMVLLVRTGQARSWAVAEARPAVVHTSPELPFLGITVALEKASPLERRAALQRLQQTGFGWVRQRLDWGQIQPTPVHYDWRASDALVTDIVAAGLAPVLVLDGSPAWARAAKDRNATDNPLAPPADPSTFARFAAAVASRYGHQVHVYQLWDEPNIAPHWGNRLIEPVGYAQLLKTATPMVRAADPDAVIILAALAPTRDRGHLAVDEVYFLQRLYAAGAAPFFDVVAAQPFGFGAGPTDERVQITRLNFQRVRLLRRTMITAGDGTKPIWAVRYGWNTRGDSPWRTVRPTDQIAFAMSALTIAQTQWPWLTAMGWAIDQPVEPHTNPPWGFALTPPLATAFRTWQPPADQPISSITGLVSLHWYWLAGALLWLVIGWRVGAALALLPWALWQRQYDIWPLWRKVTAWLLLALIYYFATWPPLILLCWLTATLLILPAPITGVALSALLVPFYFQHKEIAIAGLGFAIPPAHAALGCLGGAIVARRVATGNLRNVGGVVCNRQWMTRLQPMDRLALLWLGINLLSSISGWRWPGVGQGLLNLALLPLLAYAATSVLVTTPKQRTLILTALVAGGLLAALGGLVRWGQGAGTAADGVLRLVGPYFSPNHMALYLERSWWAGLGLALSCPSVYRRWLWPVLGIIGLALWLTASRGAWVLGMPAGAIVLLWAANLWRPAGLMAIVNQRRSVVVITALLTLLLIGLIGPMVGGPLWERLANSATVAERLRIWQATLHLWQDHWLVGVGSNGFFWFYPRYWVWTPEGDPNLLHPHNLWLELLASWGVLGLGWFLLVGWQVGQILYRTKRAAQHQPTWQGIGLLAALGAGVAHGQVDTFGALPDLMLWNWIALGLLVSQRPSNVQRPKV